MKTKNQPEFSKRFVFALYAYFTLSLYTWPVTVYSYIMGKKEKLMSKAVNNPSGLRFEVFSTLMSQAGWVLDHQTGSHQIWYSPCGHRISVQDKSGKAKGYQVKQFLRYIDEEETNDE